MKNSIEITGLCKAYDSFSLQDVSFTLPAGSIMGLIGENGSGKTTTLKCILNLIRRDSGQIRLLGYDNISQERLAKQDVGVVLDECFFHDTLRAPEVGRILAPCFQNWDHDLFRHYLAKFRLPAQKFIKEYSRGMKMKLSLAAALAHHPKLLILDEATSGLDPVVRDEILDEFLGFIQDEDHSILMSSHITSDLEKVADYITYIHQGQVILSDSKDAILEQYGRLACSQTQLESIPPDRLLRVRKGSFGCQGLVKDRTAFRRAHPELMVEPVTLEEIMVFIGKGDEA